MCFIFMELKHLDLMVVYNKKYMGKFEFNLRIATSRLRNKNFINLKKKFKEAYNTLNIFFSFGGLKIRKIEADDSPINKTQ